MRAQELIPAFIWETRIMIDYCCELPKDSGQIEHLLDRAFGPGRFAKTAYRLREAVDYIPELSLVAWEEGVMRGSLRFWPIEIGDAHTPALLLGPLVVDPEHRGRGIALRLMELSLQKAAELGHSIVVLVGDEPYYARVGFSAAAARGLSMPGPVDRARLLARELVPGALNGISGLIHKTHPAKVSTHSQPTERLVANQ
ncbi:MAG: N-acetyltransferase [Alphaproteobacteria bacterium]|nr:N-acetyltransferase [Alphaproteobacteria bacterium]